MRPFCLAVMMTIILPSAAAMAADAGVLRLFTATDAAPLVSAASTDPWTFSVRPLYGGSDPSTFAVASACNETLDNAKPLTVIDVPLPPALQPGDALVGRAWDSARSVNLDPGVPLPLELSAIAADGTVTALGRVTLPRWPSTTIFGNMLTPHAAPVEPFRLPIAFDPAHRPARLRLQLLLPPLGTMPNGRTTVFTDLRLVHGAGVAPEPTTRPANDPSPPWPPADTLARDVRQFQGNDFDPRLTTDDPDDAPVTADLGGGIFTVTAASPLGLRTIPILSVDDPGVTAGRYAVTGGVSYGGAAGDDAMDGYGYLELVSDFSGGRQTVTRTLADSGVQRALRGRSGQRPFALPVDAGADRPTRVRLNLVLSARGSVTLSDLKLVQYDAAPATQPAAAAQLPPAASELESLRLRDGQLALRLADLRGRYMAAHPAVLAAQRELGAVRDRIRQLTPAPATPPWWTRDRTVTTGVGGFGLIGLVAFLFPLARRGRGLAVALMIAVAAVGQLYFGWAMAVLGHGDGPRTWGPLLACAAVAFAVPALLPLVNRRFRDAELRRMRALDAVAAL